MAERKIIITKEGIEYGEDLKTLEELLPTMCVSVAYACRALGKNPINAFIAVSGVFSKAEKPEEFGVIKETKQTNADWIRNMTNEELTDFVASIDNNECTGETIISDSVVLKEMEDIKEWLESERD